VGLVLAAASAAGAGRRAEPPAGHPSRPVRGDADLRQIARSNGLVFRDAPPRLESTEHRFAFPPETRRASYNGDIVWLHEAPRRVRGAWVLREADRASFLDPFLRRDRYLREVPRGTVFLDPGHGGHDTGATGRGGSTEKHLTLDVCRLVQQRLSRRRVDVRLTRSSDRYMALEERCRTAARGKAALFVSIHFNSSGNTSAHGLETYVMPVRGERSTSGSLKNARVVCSGNRYDAANMILAQCIHHRTRKGIGAADRGVRKARFMVLRNAPCPAVLMECGFLSNRSEEQRIKKRSHQEKLAEGIAGGILDYLGAVRAAAPGAGSERAARPATPRG
jgi:N-acetylmuramoyl-L-alanine amidase